MQILPSFGKRGVSVLVSEDQDKYQCLSKMTYKELLDLKVSLNMDPECESFDKTREIVICSGGIEVKAKVRTRQSPYGEMLVVELGPSVMGIDRKHRTSSLDDKGVQMFVYFQSVVQKRLDLMEFFENAIQNTDNYCDSRVVSGLLSELT